MKYKIILKKVQEKAIKYVSSVSHIDKGLQGVTSITMNSAFKKLWPGCLHESNFKLFEPSHVPLWPYTCDIVKR